jgi:hypothetical protein
MSKRRWFHMSSETFEKAQQACEDLNAAQGINAELRIIWNSEHTACLVCLDGASKDWRRPHEWIDDCVEVHCRTSYPGLPQIPVVGSWEAPVEDTVMSAAGGEIFWDGEAWSQ